MATQDAVYNPTTTAPETKSTRLLVIPNPNLNFVRFLVKVGEVLLSFVAFVLEEVVSSCTSCSALYFFEFVSCTAFLFTLLLLVLLCTTLHQKVGINCWPKLDFVYTVLICVFLVIASIAFAANNSGSGLEKATVAFGFLAAIVFLVDVALFWKTKGFPFSNNDPEATSSPPEAEIEKLNSNRTNGTN